MNVEQVCAQYLLFNYGTGGVLTKKPPKKDKSKFRFSHFLALTEARSLHSPGRIGIACLSDL